MSVKTLDTKKVQQPEGKNGNGNPTVKPELSQTVVTEKSTVEQSPTVKGTVNQRLQKVRELASLAEKHEQLLETREKLNRFKLSTTELGDRLTLRDSNGNTFETANTAIIKDVYGLVKSSVDSLISDVENKIVF